MILLGFIWLMLVPLFAMWRGYVLCILWGWFVARTFGLPELGIAQAIGLSYVVTYLTATMPAKQEKEPEGKELLSQQIARGLVFHGLYPTVVLFFGWIVKHWL